MGELLGVLAGEALSALRRAARDRVMGPMVLKARDDMID